MEVEVVKALPWLALPLTIAAWVLTVLTGEALLSGPYEDRTCQTECVKTLFFSGLGVTIGAVVLAALALIGSNSRVLTFAILGLAAPLAAVYATIILVGNLA